jgi:hypothetical protein
MTSPLDSYQQDQVVLLDDVPSPAADAPEPFVVANERRVVIVYRIAEADFERFGPFDEDDDPFCAVEFSAAAFHQFGPPGDEGLHAHPLAPQGLRSYSAHEIVNSSLVTDSWGADSAWRPIAPLLASTGTAILPAARRSRCVSKSGQVHGQAATACPCFHATVYLFRSKTHFALQPRQLNRYGVRRI